MHSSARTLFICCDSEREMLRVVLITVLRRKPSHLHTHIVLAYYCCSLPFSYMIYSKRERIARAQQRTKNLAYSRMHRTAKSVVSDEPICKRTHFDLLFLCIICQHTCKATKLNDTKRACHICNARASDTENYITMRCINAIKVHLVRPKKRLFNVNIWF